MTHTVTLPVSRYSTINCTKWPFEMCPESPTWPLQSDRRTQRDQFCPLSLLMGSIFTVNWTRCPFLTAAPLQIQGPSTIKRHHFICLKQNELPEGTAVQLLSPGIDNTHNDGLNSDATAGVASRPAQHKVTSNHDSMIDARPASAPYPATCFTVPIRTQNYPNVTKKWP